MTALAAKVGSFTEPASTGNDTVTVSGLGVAPKLVVLWGDHRPSAGTVNQGNMHFGALTANGQFGLMHYSNSGETTTNVIRSHSGADGIYSNLTGSAVLDAAYSSFALNGSDGEFTLNWAARNGDRDIGYLAIGGDDFEAAIVQATTKTSTGTQDITGFGFDPEAILIASISHTSTPPGLQDNGNAQMSIGVCDGTTEYSVHTFTEDGLSTSNTCRKHASHVLDIGHDGNDPGASLDIASFDSWITDGVRLDYTTADGNARYFWVIGLRGVNFKAGTFATATSTGSATEVSGISGTPSAAILFSVMQANASGFQDHATMSVGAVDSSGNEFCTGYSDEDDQTTTDCERYESKTKAIRVYDQNGTMKTSGDASFSGTDLDVNYDTADGSNAYEYGYLVLSSAAAATDKNLLTLGAG